MSKDPFAGSSRDPIALLEQLIGQVGGLKSHIDMVKQELKQEIGQVKQELKQEIGQVKQELGQFKQEVGSRFDDLRVEIGLVRTDIASVRGEMVRFATAVDKDHEAFKGSVEATLDRKNWLARHEWQDKYAEIERRVADLEVTERRRQEGKGA